MPEDFIWDKDRNARLHELKQRIAGRMGRVEMDAGGDRDVCGTKPAIKRKGGRII